MAVVGEEEDEGVVVEAAGLQGAEDAADLRVEVGDLAVVGREHPTGLRLREAGVGVGNAARQVGVHGPRGLRGDGLGHPIDPAGVLGLELAGFAVGHRDVGGVVHRVVAARGGSHGLWGVQKETQAKKGASTPRR